MASRRLSIASACVLTVACADGKITQPDPREPPVEVGTPSDSIILARDSIHVSASDYAFVVARTSSGKADSGLSWSIADGAVAWYSRIQDTLISVWGKRPGSTVLTISLGDRSRKIPVVVGPEQLSGIYLSSRVLGIAPGGIRSVDAFLRTVQGNNGSQQVTWTTDNPIVTVNGGDVASGRVTAAVAAGGPGTATVRATAGGITTSFIVRVPTAFASVAVGRSHGCATKVEGAIYCWGLNDFHQLGTAESGAHLPAEIAQLPRFVEMSAAPFGTCGRTSDGEVQCWGSVINGKEPPARVPFPAAITQLAVGGAQVCGVSANEKVYCAGHGYAAGASSPMLKGDPVTPMPVPEGVIRVTAGRSHTCALGSSGAAYCWGHDDFGQLGDSSAEQSATAGRGKPERVVGGHKFVALFGGLYSDHTCGVTVTGATLCWGAYVEDESAPTTAACRTSSTGATVVVSPCTPVPIRMSVEFTPVQVEGYAGSGCALDSDGRLHCWGRTPEQNDPAAPFRRRPQVVPTDVRLERLSLSFDFACGIGTDRLVHCWGDNRDRQAGHDFQTYVAPAPNIVYGASRIASPSVIASN